MWHTQAAEDVARRLTVDVRVGLSKKEARRRIRLHGRNEIRVSQGRPPGRILLDQFTDFMILVLLAAAVVSGVVGDPPDAIAIVVIVLLNGAIGFVQEYRAEQAIAALQRLAGPTATVLRDGRPHTVPSARVAPGDVVLLEAGGSVPADLRLVDAAQLKTQEAALTGESVSVDKHPGVLSQGDLPLGERLNMAYKGTAVTNGRGTGIAVATGMRTELGKIALLLREEGDVKTPLQKRLSHFGQRLALVALGICTLVFLAGVLRGESVVLMFLTAISLAVAAIPEALPAVVTISLALGARKLVRKQALIRTLPAVETLGSVTYICSDKTGTLTQNRMQLEQIAPAGQPPVPVAQAWGQDETWRLLGQALALCNDTRTHDRGELVGDPTEVALYQAVVAAGFEKERLSRSSPRVGEIPFDAERKRMTTLHREPDGRIMAYVKGAPEQVIERCDTVLRGAEVIPLDRASVSRSAERMAADGLRVLAVAFRRWPHLPTDLSPKHVECELTWLGLVGLLDPPRPETYEAIRLCQSAGITPVMITGDHPATARTIAERLGIIAQGGEVMTGQALARLSPKDVDRHVERIRVYARVAPEQKLIIVKALQDKGEFVAMTGDGVNDAPSLKRANIGVAMGVAGTDVAREASHMILLDDNFATIVTAVREGRRIFDNIRKFIRYTMTSNTGEISTIVLAPLFGLPIPLLPIHILWINLVTDGLPGLALAAEPEERGIMQRPPRPPTQNIFAQGMWQDILWVGLLMGGVSLFSLTWHYHAETRHWQTMVFTVLTLSQMGNVLALRSERESLFSLGLWTNRPLLFAVLLTVCLQLTIIYVPVFRPIFKTDPLEPGELIICLLLSSIVFLAIEVQKWLIRRSWLRRA